MAKRSTQVQSRTQGGRARVPQRAPPRSVCTTASPAATAVSAAAGQDKRVLTPISSSSSTIRRVKRVASLVVAPGQRTKCQDAAVLGSHARQKGSAGAADRKHGSAAGGDDKREQGRGGKGKYDKEYFKTRTSSYASVFGRGDACKPIPTLKPKTPCAEGLRALTGCQAATVRAVGVYRGKDSGRCCRDDCQYCPHHWRGRQARGAVASTDARVQVIRGLRP